MSTVSGFLIGVAAAAALTLVYGGQLDEQLRGVAAGLQRAAFTEPAVSESWDVSSPARASDPSLWDLPTVCRPWTVRDVTRHLAATFQRFADMLEQSRTGDLTPPFSREELDDANLRAVAEFEGDPEVRLRQEADRFLEMIGDGDEIMAHQLGPIPVSLQVLFGLTDLVLHHHDIAAAGGGAYRPAQPMLDQLVPVWRELGIPLGDGDPWDAMVAMRT